MKSILHFISFILNRLFKHIKKYCLYFDCQQLDKERTFERVRIGNSDVENQVKSRAVVKYSAVQVPSNFARLQCNTDLNLPPSNWLTSTAESYGLQHVLSKSTGFSRLVCVNAVVNGLGGLFTSKCVLAVLSIHLLKSVNTVAYKNWLYLQHYLVKNKCFLHFYQ